MENSQLGDAMNKATRALVMVLAAVMAGCSSMEISYDYDPKANFTGLKSYGWLNEPQNPTGDPRVDGNTILEKRIHEAVDTGSPVGFCCERPAFMWSARCSQPPVPAPTNVGALT